MHARTFGVERQSPAGIALQEDGDWDSNETSAAGFEVESLAEKSGWQQIPPWLQIILTIGIALLIYYGILTLIQQKHKNKEEIVHYKDGTGDPENMYQIPARCSTDRSSATGKSHASAKQARWAGKASNKKEKHDLALFCNHDSDLQHHQQVYRG